ncbi:unnamed protein product [Sphagnum jensenii]|uniref:Uncharacterized protein n=1 Tax=Sphagnum jensenii TaxID=128206 RepID=A0ABP0VF32_9BRYO
MSHMSWFKRLLYTQEELDQMDRNEEFKERRQADRDFKEIAKEIANCDAEIKRCDAEMKNASADAEGKRVYDDYFELKLKYVGINKSLKKTEIRFTQMKALMLQAKLDANMQKRMALFYETLNRNSKYMSASKARKLAKNVKDRLEQAAIFSDEMNSAFDSVFDTQPKVSVASVDVGVSASTAAAAAATTSASSAAAASSTSSSSSSSQVRYEADDYRLAHIQQDLMSLPIPDDEVMTTIASNVKLTPTPVLVGSGAPVRSSSSFFPSSSGDTSSRKP